MNSNKLSIGYKKDIYVLTVIVTFMILGNLITMSFADNFDVIWERNKKTYPEVI